MRMRHPSASKCDYFLFCEQRSRPHSNPAASYIAWRHSEQRGNVKKSPTFLFSYLTIIAVNVSNRLFLYTLSPVVPRQDTKWMSSVAHSPLCEEK